MRQLPLIAVLLASLAAINPAPAEETLTGAVIEKVQPLFKALSMIGTPYKFGGSNPDKGLDCSGFVRLVYKESAGVSLPHSAEAMSSQGEQVAESELKPGDLVFFNTLKKPFSHVGIYKGDGEFVHASSHRSKAVTVSRLDANYWASRFSGARRVLPTE